MIQARTFVTIVQLNLPIAGDSRQHGLVDKALFLVNFLPVISAKILQPFLALQ